MVSRLYVLDARFYQLQARIEKGSVFSKKPRPSQKKEKRRGMCKICRAPLKLDHEKFSYAYTQELKECSNRCLMKVKLVEEVIHTEIHGLQNRLTRCFQDCHDDAQLKLPSNQ